ncbi:MAG: hypothetical protein OEW65_02160 [Thermoleophilia bacterium]|nr:hypothetical protein [Thermoleophilia bacterium]
MTSVARVYVATGAVLLFFVLWATIATSPWPSATRRPEVDALALREAVVRQRAAAAQQRYEARWAAYRAALARNRALTVSVSAPPVRIVQVPPVATTRSS